MKRNTIPWYLPLKYFLIVKIIVVTPTHPTYNKLGHALSAFLMNLLLMLSFSRHQAHGVGTTLVFILQTGKLSHGKESDCLKVW